jgi:hypothetical protein
MTAVKLVCFWRIGTLDRDPCIAEDGQFRRSGAVTNMRSLVFISLFLAGQLSASPWRPTDQLLNAIRFVESSNGQFLYGDGGRSLGEYQMSRAAWQDVSTWRKSQGKTVYSYRQNVMNPGISRGYAADYLVILESQLRKELKRRPTSSELYAAYNLGFSTFAQHRFKLGRVNSVTQQKCRKVETIVQVTQR